MDMWARLYGVSTKRRRRLRAKWVRAGEDEIGRRREELALDADSLRVLEEWAKGCGEFDLRRRILSIYNWADGWPPGYIAEAFRCAPSTVHRNLNRYRNEGPGGLVDRRRDNGPRKVDEKYLKMLTRLVYGRPTDFGERRPTWTRELLVKVAARKTGVTVHVSTMSRALAEIGARLGRPRPSVNCPWPKPKRERRIAGLKRLIARLPSDEVALWEDEVDVHLNPKIGPDWMLKGQQKEVVTPGKNQKRYIAGAIHAVTKKMVWVTGERKTSALFITLLWRLASRYRRFRVIHLILDNYIIHKSKITARVVAAFGGKIKLHFLPPYCPNDNPIERVWEDFHANVTRNHPYKTVRALMARAEEYLEERDEGLKTSRRRKAA
jgi:transposase